MARKKKPPTSPPAAKKSKARTPPFKHYPLWTESKFWAFLRSGLRSTYNKFPVKWDVLKEAKRPYTGKGKQQKWEFLCASCGKYFKATEVSVDHIIPAGKLNSYEDVAGFVERLFVGQEGLQVLCNVCHKKKTMEDKLL